jgi:hypothetical protein
MMMIKELHTATTVNSLAKRQHTKNTLAYAHSQLVLLCLTLTHACMHEWIAKTNTHTHMCLIDNCNLHIISLNGAGCRLIMQKCNENEN